MKAEGEPKVNQVVTLSEAVVPNTATRGQEMVNREVDRLKGDWDSFLASLVQVLHFLAWEVLGLSKMATIHTIVLSCADQDGPTELCPAVA